MIVHALIPARGGSKTIPRKNVREYRGRPLITWSIELALSVPTITRVVVSTDCREIADIARESGADVPFLRPAEISGDISVDYECALHYLTYLHDNGEETPDLIVHLRPTYPNRSRAMLESALALFMKDGERYHSLRSVVPAPISPMKCYIIGSDSQLQPLYPDWIDMCALYRLAVAPCGATAAAAAAEPYNSPRQILPACYFHNGAIDIVWSRTVLEEHSISGSVIMPFIMADDETNDIDTEKDWQESVTAAGGK